MQLCLLISYLIHLSILQYTLAGCHNNCNRNGLCNRWSQCECFNGWEGNDCSKRSCPSGTQFADVAYSKDKAHQSATCSGRGLCDYTLGQCKCYPGYNGKSCEKSNCPNSCSNHGRCISLRTAAAEYDGWGLNHTSVYNLWDADLIYGCQCDPGWISFDCSERPCDKAADPRLPTLRHEIVTLTCTCSTSCSGLFKLRFSGITAKSFLSSASTGSDVAASLLSIQGTFGNSSAYSPIPISAGLNITESSQAVCNYGTTTRTKIYFRRQAGDVPAISFYQNRIKGGELYFEVYDDILYLYPSFFDCCRDSDDPEYHMRLQVFLLWHI